MVDMDHSSNSGSFSCNFGILMPFAEEKTPT
jgi:hypothetical protein